MVTYAAEETRDAERTIPRALMLGVAVVVAVYIALNAAYVLVLPLDRVLASTRIAADAAAAVAGPRASTAISVLVVISALGAMSGIILAGPRVYYAMARDGLLFEWMGAVHPRFQSPHAAIAAQAVWSSILVMTGSYRALFTRVVYTEWIFFGALALGVMRLRRSAGYQPAFRAWGFPIAPLVFASICFGIVPNGSRRIGSRARPGWRWWPRGSRCTTSGPDGQEWREGQGGTEPLTNQTSDRTKIRSVSDGSAWGWGPTRNKE